MIHLPENRGQETGVRKFSATLLHRYTATLLLKRSPNASSNPY